MQSDAVGQDKPAKERGRKLWILLGVWALAIVALIPALCRWTAVPKSDGKLVQYLGYIVVAAICACIYRRESRRLTRAQAFVLTFLGFLLTCIVNSVHSVFVDHGVPYLPRFISNVLWQGLVND